MEAGTQTTKSCTVPRNRSYGEERASSGTGALNSASCQLPAAQDDGNTTGAGAGVEDERESAQTT